MPEVASNLAGVARAKALAGMAGVTNVAVVRGRLVLQPLTLDDEQRGRLAPLGAVFSERERKLMVPLPYGEPVLNGVLGTMAAIVSLL
jgi:hypothetical protein